MFAVPSGTTGPVPRPRLLRSRHLRVTASAGPGQRATGRRQRIRTPGIPRDENHTAMLRIRIRIHRIHMFLGLLDPDPLVEVWIRILLLLSKNSKKNLDFYYFVTSF